MNRYPLWLYVTIAVALALGVLYTLPNFFGEAPAVQVSPARATLNMDNSALGRVEEALKKAGIAPTGTIFDPNSVRVRLVDPDTQLRAKDVIERTLNPDPANPSYTVALNLLPNSPRWLAAVNALPMYLGLDLRGGGHFLLQVDMHAALVKQLDSDAGDIRTQLRDKAVRYVGIAREGDRILVRFRDADTRAKARGIIAEKLPELQLADEGAGDDLRLVATVRRKPRNANRTSRSSRTSRRCTTASTSWAWRSPSSSSRARTASWSSCRACRTPPRRRRFLAAPRRSKCGSWTKTPSARAAPSTWMSSPSAGATAP